MKKSLSIIFSAFAAFCLLSSCKGDPGMNGHDGLDGRDGAFSISNVVINVPQTYWEYSDLDNNNFFYYTVDMPEITRDVADYGLVKMYRAYDICTDKSVQVELPYVRHNEYPYYDNLDNEYWGFYTETVDYEFGVGYLTICYTASDFDYELDETFWPEDMQFRCVVML